MSHSPKPPAAASDSVSPSARKMTVLQMLPALESGGVERGVIEVAEALIAAGHRAIVVSGGGRMVAELEALDAEHITLPVGRKSLWTLRLVPTIRRLLVEERVDILHLRSRAPAWVGWLAWRKLPAHQRPRLVTTVHGLYSPSRYSAIMTRGERVIAVSDTIVGYIRRHYPDVAPERIIRIHRGVDPAVFPHGYRPDSAWLGQWRAEYPQLVDRWVITLPGRITRLKGQKDLLEITRRLREAGVPVHALIVGGAHPRKRRYLAEIEAEIARRNLGADVTITGQRGDLKQIMAVSEVVLSLTQKPESFGRVSVEALSLGRPVLGYAHGGVGEQLGMLYPAGAVAPCAVEQAADRLLEWYRHGAPAVGAEMPFTLERMQSETLAVYQQLVSERS